MRTALDSSVLILLYRKQPGWEAWRNSLQLAALQGELIISPIAFSEFSIAYPSVESALADLDRLHIFYDPITPSAAYRAGQIFLRYRREVGHDSTSSRTFSSPLTPVCRPTVSPPSIAAISAPISPVCPFCPRWSDRPHRLPTDPPAVAQWVTSLTSSAW